MTQKGYHPQGSKFLPFEDAREFVWKLGIKNAREWERYRVSGEKPDSIPSNPQTVYKQDWQGFGDWLRAGRPLPARKRQYWPFEEARAFVHTLSLKSVAEWQDYCKSGKNPVTIPYHPDATYVQEWQGYGDWLGTGNVAPKDREFLPFEDAREFVHTLSLKSHAEWNAYRRSGERPADIPSNPNLTYAQAWQGYNDWLGPAAIAHHSNQENRIVEQARAFVHNHRSQSIVCLDDSIFTYKQWLELARQYNYTCLCCKRREPEIKLVADHVIPLSKGGPNHIDNIQPLCRSCNSRKRSRSTDYRQCT